MDISFARKHIEQLYFDKCSVIEYQHVTEDNLSFVREVQVYTDIPCHISHKTIVHATESMASNITLVSKLHVAPDIRIKAGSKIIVTRNGVSTVYKNSGEPAVYQTHQEIVLELEDDRA